MKYEVEFLSHKSFIYTFKKFQKVLLSSRKFKKVQKCLRDLYV